MALAIGGAFSRTQAIAGFLYEPFFKLTARQGRFLIFTYKSYFQPATLAR
jgi:hypothetical protein